MPTVVEISIATIRRLMARPLPIANEHALKFHMAIHKLRMAREKLISVPAYLDDVLRLSVEIESYRGKGCFNGARDLAQLFTSILYVLDEKLPEPEVPFVSFGSARETIPSESLKWDILEKLSNRALRIVQGPPTRSAHTSYLKSEAWSQLTQIIQWVRDPSWLELAQTTTAELKNPRPERSGALAFIEDYFLAYEEINQASIDLLENLQENETERSMLVGIMQLQIDFGLSNEFKAMDVLDDFDNMEEE